MGRERGGDWTYIEGRVCTGAPWLENGILGNCDGDELRMILLLLFILIFAPTRDGGEASPYSGQDRTGVQAYSEAEKRFSWRWYCQDAPPAKSHRPCHGMRGGQEHLPERIPACHSSRRKETSPVPDMGVEQRSGQPRGQSV
jgi:hypothetical protein